MRAQIDCRQGDLEQYENGALERLGLADKREDGSVMRRVGRGVEQREFWYRSHRLCEPIDGLFATSLAHVRYAFDHVD